jgi:hypothetical protein
MTTPLVPDHANIIASNLSNWLISLARIFAQTTGPTQPPGAKPLGFDKEKIRGKQWCTHPYSCIEREVRGYPISNAMIAWPED